MAAELKDPIEIYRDDYIKVLVMDEQGAGGAHHVYRCYPIHADPEMEEPLDQFQEGPIQEVGVNGYTNEALLAIVEHRLECFNAGPFSCRENAIAKTHIETGHLWLDKRTRDRKNRGVEGKNQA